MGETFIVPQELTRSETMLIPGLDGAKMSKSKNNILNVFDEPGVLKKLINKEIVTDATPLEDPKNPDDAVVWKLYNAMAGEVASQKMADQLRAGGYGWGHAKKELLEAIVDGFATERAAFNRWMDDPGAVDAELAKGAAQAREVAGPVLERVRSRLGY
jgi:tryptophanyl-tRNA synthetase